jgi:hypothetical protein
MKIVKPTVLDKYGRPTGRMMYGRFIGGQLLKQGYLDPWPLNRPSWEEKKAFVRSAGMMLPGDAVGRITVMLPVDPQVYHYQPEVYRRRPDGWSFRRGGILYAEFLPMFDYFEDDDDSEEISYPLSGLTPEEFVRSFAPILDDTEGKYSWDGTKYTTYGDLPNTRKPDSET